MKSGATGRVFETSVLLSNRTALPKKADQWHLTFQTSGRALLDACGRRGGADLFVAFVERVLVPDLCGGSIVVMDSLAPHWTGFSVPDTHAARPLNASRWSRIKSNLLTGTGTRDILFLICHLYFCLFMYNNKEHPVTHIKKRFKQARIYADIRERIISGVYAPQAALPTRAQMISEFDASVVTVQKVIDRLEHDGFVRSKWGSGTFVAANPPHLCRYALAFPSRRDGIQDWTDWWTILEQAAATVTRAEPQKQIVSYYEIAGHADVEDYQCLLADVSARRLAGIILLSGPQLLINTPLVDDSTVPRVYIGGELGPYKIPGVAPDLHSFVDRALKHAAGRSRRRPVLVCPHFGMELTWRVWSEACRRHGMEPARRQILSLPLLPHEAPRHLTQTLMLLPPEHRPDTLVVADDHFVEEVTAGLLASNLPEGELPTVVAHANFPKPPRALVPVTYLGYDSVGIIRTCIDVLDAQRRGETPPRVTPVFAAFASEQSNIETTPVPISSSPALRDFAAG